jgi:ubiquinone/menaquinone biosynthesis C-methylase UbiE
MSGESFSEGSCREMADVETSSSAYADRFAGATGAWMLEIQAAAVRTLLNDLPPGSRLLEVGGGHGQLAGPLLDAGYDLTVVGSAPECRERLRRYETSGRCRFLVSDLLALPFEAGAFEAVLAIRLLTHCERWRALVAELGRVARQAVIVEFPVHEGLHRLAPIFFGAKKRMEGNTRRWRPFRKVEILEAFRDVGYECDRWIRQFFWPLVLHRVLRNRAISERLELAARRLGWTERAGSPIIARMVPRRR